MNGFTNYNLNVNGELTHNSPMLPRQTEHLSSPPVLALVATAVLATASAALATAAHGPARARGERADLIVAADNSGDTRTIQAAIDRIPLDNRRNRIILVRAGTYPEKLFLGVSHVSIVGEDRDRTRIEFPELRRNWRAGHPDDWGAAVVNIADNVSDVVLANLTVRNTYGALHGDHDHQFAIRGGVGVNRVVLLDDTIAADGGDTLSLWNTDSGMYYHADCTFEGWVDYVCPRGWCYITNSRFIGHSRTASIWHDGSLNPDAKLVVRRSSFDGDDNFALGRNNRDGQFYLLDCLFSAAMANRPIYLPSPRESYRWGERYYYFGDRRDTGDYAWFTNNLSAAPGAPAPADITARWTFHGRWDPERSTPAVLPFAALPEPENGATTVSTAGLTLRWTAGRNATSHIVRFGDGPHPPIVARAGATRFATGPLHTGVTYYWQIDEVTADGTIPGHAWRFRTRAAAAGPSAARR
jgi:pectinesterase